jgi:predicted nucleotidyltransferase
MADATTEAALSALEALVQRIVEAVHPLRIVLFGSAARGEFGPDSDMDLLVVMPEGTHRLETMQFLHTRLFGIPLAVDILVATPQDLARHANSPGLIYRTILEQGKELYVA